MIAPDLKAPFPYFGGKRTVADLVWSRLGDVNNYIEPFAGSAAMLLARPTEPHIETLNDADCYVANFWRATGTDPEAVATHADNPVNEADLHARHRWLVLSEDAAAFRRRIRTEPDYFDPKVAGWWCWGLCCWIGSGWCSESELRENGTPREKRPHPDARGVIDNEVQEKRPQLHTGNSEHGRGVHAKVPDLREQAPTMEQCRGGGKGVNGVGPNGNRRPFLSCGRSTGDRGINVAVSDSHRPQLADAHSRGRGVHANDSAGTCAQRRAWLLDWFERLRDRLRTVRVCCGDWKRVCDSPSVTTRLGLTGIFLDPPYAKTRTDGTANRSGDLYANDKSQDVDRLVADVQAYCLERGGDRLMRIAVCGYECEGYERLEEAGWSVVPWKTNGGYGNRKGSNDNSARERLWFSPHCIDPTNDSMPLFARIAAGEEAGA